MTKKSKTKKGLFGYKWYLIFGVFALMIAAGVFWAFDTMYQYNIEKANSLKADINFATINEFTNQHYEFPTDESNLPILVYFAIALICMGVIGFFISKVFYEKSKE